MQSSVQPFIYTDQLLFKGTIAEFQRVGLHWFCLQCTSINCPNEKALQKYSNSLAHAFEGTNASKYS
jgi:hypothetical protein